MLAKTFIRVLILAVGILSVAAADARSEIQAEYDGMLAAFRRGDWKDYYSHCAPTYWERNEEGRRSLDQAKQRAKRQMVPGLDASIKLDKVIPASNTAIVKMTLTVKRKETMSGKTHEYVGTGHYTENWERKGKRWLMVSSVEISFHTTLDGKQSTKAGKGK